MIAAITTIYHYCSTWPLPSSIKWQYRVFPVVSYMQRKGSLGRRTSEIASVILSIWGSTSIQKDCLWGRDCYCPPISILSCNNRIFKDMHCPEESLHLLAALYLGVSIWLSSGWWDSLKQLWECSPRTAGVFPLLFLFSLSIFWLECWDDGCTPSCHLGQ